MAKVGYQAKAGYQEKQLLCRRARDLNGLPALCESAGSRDCRQQSRHDPGQTARGSVQNAALVTVTLVGLP